MAYGVQTCSGEDAGLPHRATHQRTQVTCSIDPLAGRDHGRSHRRTEAFRQADRQGVEQRAVLPQLYAGRYVRVPDPCAVTVKRDTCVITYPADLAQRLERIDRS